MDTFSSIMRQLLESSNITMRQLYRKLNENNADISYPALGSYKNYDSVPSFDRARMIFDAFGYDATDDELSDILQYSRAELKTIREDDQTMIQQGVRLSPKNFSKDMKADELRSLIDDRIAELAPDINNFNSYITRLIKDDLIQSGLLPLGEDK